MNALLPDRLHTQRLVLRKPRESDAVTIFHRHVQDVEVSRYTVWQPHISLAQTEGVIAECLEDWESGTAQAYVITSSDDVDHALGMIEIRAHAPAADIGYGLGRRHWGNGYAPEAACALTELVLADARFFRVQATCDVENHASARTLEKAGFTREGQLERYTVHPNISPEPRACFLYARCR